MATKTEYVVLDGCIQDAGKIILKGEVFESSNKDLIKLLVEEGKFARRGQLPSKDDSDDGD